MSEAELTAIRQALAANPDFDSLPFQDQRGLYEGFANAMPRAADISYAAISANGVPAEWSSTPGADQGKVVLYLHGGGYVMGSLVTHRTMAGEIARAIGGRSLALDYRLAPEHPFPAAVDDAIAGYQFLLAQGINPERIAIAGDSAGGGLTIATLVSLRDKGLPRPAAGWCISPWVDLECLGETMSSKAAQDPMCQKDGLLRLAALYMNGKSPSHPLASPINADLSGLPTLLIQVGSDEVLLDDAVNLARRAGAQEVPVALEIWPKMVHVWHFFGPMLEEGREAITSGGEFIKHAMA